MDPTSLDQHIQDVEASGYDKMMAALPELPSEFEALKTALPRDLGEIYIAKIRDYAIAAMTAYSKILMQAITDPENQPSQFGTVTVEYMEKRIARDLHAIRQIALEQKKLIDLMGSRPRNPDTRTTP